MIFKFRALSDGGEKFARDYEVAEDDTLWNFHEYIQEDLDYDPDQMASFFSVGKDWAKVREYTLFDMGDDASQNAPLPMDKVAIHDVASKKGDRILYTFDVFNYRSLFLELIEILEPEEGLGYPITSLTIGDAPKQLADGDQDADEGSIYGDIMEDFDGFESYEESNDRSDDDF